MRAISLVVLAIGLISASVRAEAKTICTIVTDAADGKILAEQGDCRSRVTPASTFKIALALMGFDSSFLQDAHAPVLLFKPGYADWGGENWKQPTDPTRWLKYSVVWYSRIVTQELGQARVTDYALRFGFGNADFSGDPGKNNGMDRAWIMSSLQISPIEQVSFLRKLVNRTLAVSPHAIDETLKVVEMTPASDGWEAHGKTGTAYPRNADGSFDETHGYGWYVGWMVKGDRTLLFARLDRDEQAQLTSTGFRVRAEFLEDWPSLAASLH